MAQNSLKQPETVWNSLKQSNSVQNGSKQTWNGQIWPEMAREAQFNRPEIAWNALN
jgi:hypothetical protein